MGIDTGAEFLRGADALLVQGEDPWQDPTGGIVSFTKCLLRAYGQRVAVASPSDADLPVGVWTERSFEGRRVAFFNLGPLKLKRGKSRLCRRRFRSLAGSAPTWERCTTAVYETC